MRRLAILAGALLALASASARAEQVVDEARPTGIQVVVTDQGPVYADASGKTIYTWTGDSHPGKSLCNNDHYARVDGQGQVKFHLPDSDTRPTCAQTWPAVAATGAPTGPWGAITRDDGSKQLTYAGKPLYTTVLDKAPGDVYGRDMSVFGARQPLAAPSLLPPGLTIAVTTKGRTLTNAEGWTLYTFDGDSAGKSACEGACAATWVPAPAPELAPAKADWSTVQRSDGSKQWAYKGKPLYTYANDERRRDLGGEAIPRWKAAIVQPAPRLPTAVKINTTSAGDVFADAQGMTLYTFRCVDEAPDTLSCDTEGASPLYRLTICGGPEKCMATWKPLAASPSARSPNKTWTIVDVDPATGNRDPKIQNGLKVWAYNGRPVYTYAGDHRPGDYKGHDMRVFPTRGFTMMLVSTDR